MPMQISEQGRFYEDFSVGDLFEHRLGRTVLATDNVWFTLLTVNPNPIHFDAHYASQTEWGRPLVDSTFTLALVTGLSVADISQNAVNLGWDDVRLPAPVFEGDTIYAQSEVVADASVEEPPPPGDRQRSHARLQPGGRCGHQVQTHVARLQAGPRPADEPADSSGSGVKDNRVADHRGASPGIRPRQQTG